MVALMHNVLPTIQQVVSVAVYIPSRFSLFELCACQETEKTKVEMYNILACSEFKVMYVYMH